MFDAMVGAMFAPPPEVAVTNTISGVLCISDTHVWGETVHTHSTVSKVAEHLQ